MAWRNGALILSAVAGLAVSGLSAPAARAADYSGIPPARDGVDCEDPVVKGYDSVWLGHFSGGYSHALAPGLPIVLDWRDEKLCFPSKGSCDRYMSVMRREFHHPEGYFTCLVIR